MSALPLSVLVVEDDALLASAFCRGIRQAKGTCVDARTLREAVEQLTDPSVVFDVIVLDLGLTDSVGIATLRTVRAVTETPIVVVTGCDSDELTEQEAQAAGAEVMIRKPIGDLAAELAARVGILTAAHHYAARVAKRAVRASFTSR